MTNMTLETKVRATLTVVLLAVMGAVLAWEWQMTIPIFVVAGAAAGFVGGLHRRRARPQPGAADIEADWTRRAQSGAFLDTMQLFVPILVTVSWLVGWRHEGAPFVYLTGLAVLAGTDYGLRYQVLRTKER
ncbi:hypothetical protein [Nocardioides zeae]